MQLHQAPRDSQPEAGATASRSRVTRLPVGLEYRLKHGRLDPTPGVGNTDRYHAGTARNLNAHKPLSGGLECIGHQIGEHLPEAPRIRPSVGVLGTADFQLDGAPHDGRARLTRHVIRHLVHVDHQAREAHLASLHGPQIEDIVDQRLEMFATRADHRQRFRRVRAQFAVHLTLEQVSKAKNRVERCAQLMAQPG